MPRYVGMIIVPLAIVIGMYLYEELGYGNVLTFNDDKCNLLGTETMHGSEDITHYKNGIMFVSVGDLGKVFAGEAYTPGSMVTLDLSQSPPKATKCKISGFPKDIPFQPHGIYFSNATQRLYAVSHGLESGGGSRVVVFDVEEGSPVSLIYKQSITSTIFPNVGINDVIEGVNGKEIYVTQWLYAGLPAKGEHYPANLEERMSGIMKFAQTALPRTSVFRCTFDVKRPGCHRAIGGLYMANGMTKDPESNEIYVNDVFAKTVHVYDRKKDGTLIPSSKGSVKLDYMVDNIEFAAGSGGEIYAGTVPKVHKSLAGAAAKDAPGGILRISPKSNEPGFVVEPSLFMHDGTKLSSISSGFVWGKYGVVGSPYSNGILVCEL